MPTHNTAGVNRTNTEDTLRGVAERNRAFLDAARTTRGLTNKGSVGGRSVVSDEINGTRERQKAYTERFRQGRMAK